MKTLFAATAGLIALTGVAQAQEASEDWDLTLRPDQQLAIASLDYGDNLLAVRCQAGALDVLFTGAPATPAETRDVVVSMGSIRNEAQVWRAQAGQGVMSPGEPARLARKMRDGGELDIRVAQDGDASGPRRYRLPIPRSIAAVDAVLDGCGWPRVDARDDALRLAPGAILWVRQPRPDFPERAQAQRIRHGRVELNCIVGVDFRPADCQVERELPTGADFAASAVRASHNARVEAASPDVTIVGAVTRFSIVFDLPN